MIRNRATWTSTAAIDEGVEVHGADGAVELSRVGRSGRVVGQGAPERTSGAFSPSGRP